MITKHELSLGIHIQYSYILLVRHLKFIYMTESIYDYQGNVFLDFPKVKLGHILRKHSVLPKTYYNQSVRQCKLGHCVEWLTRITSNLKSRTL